LDRLEDFADAVREVLDDPAAATGLAAAARALVEREYDWRVAGRRLLERLDLVLPRRTAALHPPGWARVDR
jgi:glycosyltransferase involved in cell wall biosynthesis